MILCLDRNPDSFGAAVFFCPEPVEGKKVP
jgi:hypothetical protein